MWKISTQEVLGGEIDPCPFGFSLDLCAYRALVWVAAIINRSIVERLGDFVRFGINRLQVAQDVANREFVSNASFAGVIVVAPKPYFLPSSVTGDVEVCNDQRHRVAAHDASI